MVQDFTTSFDQFETFALSEMAKQPELIINPSTPFIPKFWTNTRESTNSIIEHETSFYETKMDANLQELYLSPRRSSRIANQSKINYNENITKPTDKQKKNKRHQKPNTNPKQKNNRSKEIRKLFKKPTDAGDISKTKTKTSETKNKSKKTAEQMSTIPNSLKISIPLMHTKLLTATSAITKASLKLFEDGLSIRKSDRSNSGRREPVPDNFKHWSLKTSKKKKQLELESVEQSQSFSNSKSYTTPNKTEFPTEEKVKNLSGSDFSGIFKSSQDDEDEEVVFVNSWKQNDKPIQNSISRSFGVKRSAFIQASEQIKKSNRNYGIIQNKSKKTKILEDIIECFEENEQQSLDNNLMEVSNEVQKSNDRENLKDYQMMETSNESNQYPEQSKNNKVLKITSKSDQSMSSITTVSVEKEFPLDLSIMDVSEEFWKPKQITTRTKSMLIEYEVTENVTIMEVSSEDIPLPTMKKISSNEAEKCLSIFDAFKKNCQIDRSYTEELDQTVLKNKNVVITATSQQAQAYEECTMLSENLSSMKISQSNQKSKTIDHKTMEKRDEPFDLTMSELSEDFQNSKNTNSEKQILKDIVPVDNIEISNDTDVIFIEPNNSSEDFQNHQSKSSNLSDNDLLDENDNDRRKCEKNTIEQLKSSMEEFPRHENETPIEMNSGEISNDKNRVETEVGGEVETCEESNASEVEVMEAESINSSEHLDENKNGDDVEMSFPQECHRLYQQEFIEVIQQCNYFTFPNLPRYEIPVEGNKLDYRTFNNLPFLSQCFGELQVPQQMNLLLDYNNLRSHRNFEPENKLEITEYFDSDEENKEGNKEKPKFDVKQNNVHNNKTIPIPTKPRSKELPVLSQPPPIQCTSESRCPPMQNNQKPPFDLQSQCQIGPLIPGNSNRLNNNQWKIVSTQPTSEQGDQGHQLYENTSLGSVQNSEHTITKDNQSEPQIVQRQTFHREQPLISEISQRYHQVKTNNNVQQGYQELSQIAQFVKNNCNIHDVRFGKIKSLNGRLYRTGSLLINFGDHYKVQVIGDVILNNIDENTAFDAFFSQQNHF